MIHVCLVFVGIFVQITGDAYCRWTEGTNDNKRTYTGNESYLNEKTFLIGGRDGKNRK